jgi:hypothetical protein
MSREHAVLELSPHEATLYYSLAGDALFADGWKVVLCPAGTGRRGGSCFDKTVSAMLSAVVTAVHSRMSIEERTNHFYGDEEE